MSARPPGFPKPERGLVISYAYLWHREHQAGRVEGAKDRPCAIVLAATRQADGALLVTVAPITHSAPDRPEAALEIPAAVKRHLRLDSERSWVVVDEFNQFTWPGYDLRPTVLGDGSYAYGLLPPRFFATMVRKIASSAVAPRLTPRDDG